MKKRQIVNIINFIGAVELREAVDMLLPVREQIRLMNGIQARKTDSHMPTFESCGDNTLLLSHRGTKYGMKLRQGCFENERTIPSEGNTVEAEIVY